MAENYYDDSPAPNTPPSNPESPESEDSNIALLPKSFFPPEKDLTPGSVCRVRVEEVQEDQVLVSYQHDESQEPEAAPALPPDEQMSGLY